MDDFAQLLAVVAAGGREKRWSGAIERQTRQRLLAHQFARRRLTRRYQKTAPQNAKQLAKIGPKHGVRGENNIRVRAVYGPNKTRLLYCLVCKKKFTEHRGTVFFNSRLPKEKVVSLLEHVVEGNGMRKTGRLVHVDPETVSRYTKLAGEHVEQLHDELVETYFP